MRILFLFAFSLIVKIGCCQNNIPTKHQIITLFRHDADNTEWVICNQDSSFFKSDTLLLYNNINYFYQKSDCCKLIQWNFYKKNAFTRSNLQVCTEPPLGSVLTKNDYFKIKLISNKSGLYLFVVNRRDPIDSFKVIDLHEDALANNQKFMVIVLKRLMDKHPTVVLSY